MEWASLGVVQEGDQSLAFYGIKRAPGGAKKYPFSVDGELHYLTQQGLLTKIHAINKSRCPDEFWWNPEKWPVATNPYDGRGPGSYSITADDSRGLTHGYHYQYTGGKRSSGGTAYPDILPSGGGTAYPDIWPSSGGGGGGGGGGTCVPLNPAEYGTRGKAGKRLPYSIDGVTQYLQDSRAEAKGCAVTYTPSLTVDVAAKAGPTDASAGRVRRAGRSRAPAQTGPSTTTLALGGLGILAVGAAVYYATR